MTSLDLSGNNLTSIKLPNSSSLKILSLYQNQLSSINLSPAPNITNLDISDNNLTSIDLSTTSNISKVNVSYNHLTKLDLQSNSNITQLYSSNNNISNFISPTNYSSNSRFDLSHQLISYDNISNVDRSALFINPVKYNHDNLLPDSISNNGTYDDHLIYWSELPADISSLFFKFNLQKGKIQYSGKVNLNLIDVSSQPTNVIPDLNFKQVLNRQLGKSDLYSPVTSKEIAAFTIIYAYDKGIKSAQGIEHATNLEQLNLTSINFGDIKAIENLDLSNNNIAEIDIYNMTNINIVNLQKKRTNKYKFIQ